MNPETGSKRWMITVRVILVLLGIIQTIFIAWARYITEEVVHNKSEMDSAKTNISHIQEDVSYIRSKLDSLFELRRR